MSTAVAAKLHAISDTTKLTNAEIGEIVDASARSISRWLSGDAEPQRLSRQRLLELAYIADEVHGVLRPEDANLWIMSPNRLLAGDTPAHRIAGGDFKSVIAVIEALADGVVL